MSVSVHVAEAYGICGHEHVTVVWVGPRVSPGRVFRTVSPWQRDRMPVAEDCVSSSSVLAKAGSCIMAPGSLPFCPLNAPLSLCPHQTFPIYPLIPKSTETEPPICHSPTFP